MKHIISLAFILSLSFFCLAVHADTEEFGIIMDVSGEITINRGENKIAAELGSTISPNDILTLTKGSTVALVSYDSCQEWILNGPDKITIKADKINSERGNISPERQLPICYSMEEIEDSKSDTIGGFVLRGAPKDPLASLRTEFKNGKASNTTLITIIMYDLHNGKVEQTEQYFKVLKSREPGSEFVRSLSKRIDSIK
jgi:hypothetical protein